MNAFEKESTNLPDLENDLISKLNELSKDSSSSSQLGMNLKYVTSSGELGLTLKSK